MVGASNRPERAGNYVLGFLVARGFDVVGRQSRPGRAAPCTAAPVVATLDQAGPLDMVDVFRRGRRRSGPVVDDAIRLGARTVWLQLGVINQAAAATRRARPASQVVMDRCPMVEWRRLGLPATAAT